jgi:hypothetical protein
MAGHKELTLRKATSSSGAETPRWVNKFYYF